LLDEIAAVRRHQSGEGEGAQRPVRHHRQHAIGARPVRDRGDEQVVKPAVPALSTRRCRRSCKVTATLLDQAGHIATGDVAVGRKAAIGDALARAVIRDEQQFDAIREEQGVEDRLAGLEIVEVRTGARGQAFAAEGALQLCLAEGFDDLLRAPDAAGLGASARARELDVGGRGEDAAHVERKARFLG
jgi:hypothetical protein